VLRAPATACGRTAGSSRRRCPTATQDLTPSTSRRWWPMPARCLRSPAGAGIVVQGGEDAREIPAGAERPVRDARKIGKAASSISSTSGHVWNATRRARTGTRSEERRSARAARSSRGRGAEACRATSLRTRSQALAPGANAEIKRSMTQVLAGPQEALPRDGLRVVTRA